MTRTLVLACTETICCILERRGSVWHSLILGRVYAIFIVNLFAKNC